jgi:hypothetical protein
MLFNGARPPVSIQKSGLFAKLITSKLHLCVK